MWRDNKWIRETRERFLLLFLLLFLLPSSLCLPLSFLLPQFHKCYIIENFLAPLRHLTLWPWPLHCLSPVGNPQASAAQGDESFQVSHRLELLCLWLRARFGMAEAQRFHFPSRAFLTPFQRNHIVYLKTFLTHYKKNVQGSFYRFFPHCLWNISLYGFLHRTILFH